MEIKAVTEYEEPKYLTKEESRNKILRCFMNVKKLGVSVWMILLINNVVLGKIEIDQQLAGDVPEFNWAWVICFGSLFCALCSLAITFFLCICGIVCLKKSRKIVDGKEKVKVKKRGKLCFIIGIVLPVFFMIVSFISCLFHYFA